MPRMTIIKEAMKLAELFLRWTPTCFAGRIAFMINVKKVNSQKWNHVNHYATQRIFTEQTLNTCNCVQYRNQDSTIETNFIMSKLSL
jgi:hypothetical protein